MTVSFNFSTHHNNAGLPMHSAKICTTSRLFLILRDIVYFSARQPFSAATSSKEEHIDLPSQLRSRTADLTMTSSGRRSAQTGRATFTLFIFTLLLLSTVSKGQSAMSNAAAKRLRELISNAIAKDLTMAGTLLRLVFHDALTIDLDSGKGGANGSIRFEPNRGENRGLERAIDVLTPMRNAAGLSWGDTVAVAGAVAVEATGGPHISVHLGRDNAATEDPRGIIPGPSSSITQLRQQFKPRGFTDRDIVALSGGHTLGRVRATGPFTARPNKFHNEYVRSDTRSMDRNLLLSVFGVDICMFVLCFLVPVFCYGNCVVISRI